MTDKYGYTTQLVENTKVLCKDGKMVFQQALTSAKNLLTHVSSRSFQLEPPKGLLHFAQAKEVHKSQYMCFQKHYPKEVFFSENFWEASHTSQQEFLIKEYPTDGFILETFSRKIFCRQLQKAAVMELLLTTTNLLRDHRVLHINCFARKSVSFVSKSKT